ncbi:NADH:ubiquinone oxidoreductase subunit K [Symmachiella macrocystis]|uniref:NADH:ubiquinone oxidoreductase subunit K n=1 Tax=Symmachiella macrocystis TaxID=2527985 RepID=A0A5C6BL02_9PLAN|nr:NADH-quinone oxidoreductase subunit K [Symmachiella macrocystis]TWU12422.1 NADH:ubiquinone oxidoreductase subunit K [Symmachiella macrocystis]
MTIDPAMLHNLLVFAMFQFVAGTLCVICRRSMFHLLLGGQIMLQGTCVALAALSASREDVSGAAWLFLIGGLATAQTVVAVTFFRVLSRRRTIETVTGHPQEDCRA